MSLFTLAAVDQELQFILNGAWSTEVEQYLVRSGVTNLKLSEPLGWESSSLDFLKTLPFVRSLTLIDSHVRDLSPLECIPSLEKLNIQVSSKATINFANLSRLRSIYLDWFPSAGSLIECTGLDRLSVSRAPEAFVREIYRIESIERLSLFNSRFETLDSLRLIKNLKALRLANFNKLYSSERLADLSNLRLLEVQQCTGFKDLTFVKFLNRLKFLSLDNTGLTQSLSPLRNHPNLECILWGGTTRVEDGKVSILRTIPNLKWVQFVNRRNYDLKEETFPKLPKYDFENL